jgi:hypothetical protein
MPAVMEASESNLPLILITGDDIVNAGDRPVQVPPVITPVNTSSPSSVPLPLIILAALAI